MLCVECGVYSVDYVGDTKFSVWSIWRECVECGMWRVLWVDCVGVGVFVCVCVCGRLSEVSCVWSMWGVGVCSVCGV